MKTQINMYVPAPEGYHEESKNEFLKVLQDDDIDFELTMIDQNEDPRMELIYLNDDMKDVPMLAISLNVYLLSKKFNRNQVENYFAQLGYAINKKQLLHEPNKQYFTANNSDSELCSIKFMNAGSHTEEEMSSIKESIQILVDNIYNNSKDFPANYYEEIAKDDKDINMALKNEDDKMLYQMTHKDEAITEWMEHKPEQDWTEFVKELHAEYKNNLPKD